MNINNYNTYNRNFNFKGHQIPKFLYHLTNEKAYNSIKRDGRLMANSNDGLIKGIFMIELSNFFKRWGISKDWCDSNLSLDLLKQVAKREKKLILLRIPTGELDKEKLLVRSQNKLFSITKLPEFYPTLKAWYTKHEIPKERFQHIFNGDKAANSRHYKQKKSAIEYIYPEDISLGKIDKIGEVKLEKINALTSIKAVFETLLQGTPEEKAIAAIKDI